MTTWGAFAAEPGPTTRTSAGQGFVAADHEPADRPALFEPRPAGVRRPGQDDADLPELRWSHAGEHGGTERMETR